MYESCINEVAANVAVDCQHPQVGGYTGRAVAVPFSINPTLTQNTSNPRIVEGIAIPEGKNVIMIDNVMPSPFDGSSKASTAENGRLSFTKTFAFRVPLRGAIASKDIIEPLLNSAQGYLVVAEKKDKAGHGSFEVIGLLSPMKTNGDGVSQNEAENDGDVTVTMSCTEPWFEAELFSTDYATSKQLFEDLISKAF